MKVIGITGGIGSGKTTFAGFLAEQGVKIVDVDALASKLIDQESSLRLGIENKFGPELFDLQGKLNRKALAQKVFSEKKQVKRLNRLFRPYLVRAIQIAISEARLSRLSCIVFDMAVLFETRSQTLFDLVVTLVSSHPDRFDRVRRIRDLSEGEIRMRMASQLTDGQKIKKADIVIRNDQDLDHLRKQALSFFESYIRE